MRTYEVADKLLYPARAKSLSVTDVVGCIGSIPPGSAGVIISVVFLGDSHLEF
jgi:hypothetical protein